MGYTTGQFGKNHLGDRNEYLPTVHGFDEFWGYLYHLDAMEDPFHRNYPQEPQGPGRSAQPAAHPRHGYRRSDRRSALGQGRQAEDHRRGTAAAASDRRHQIQHGDGRRGHSRQDASTSSTRPKPRASRSSSGSTRRRMHVVTHLSPKYEGMRNSENGWSIEEAGMAQLDDVRRRGACSISRIRDSTTTPSSSSPTDNGAENFTWPDGGQTPFAGGKGTALEGGFRVPCILRWPGKVPAGNDRERHHLRARLVPDLRRGGGQSEHRRGAARREGRSAARPTRCISTATTSSTSSPARRRRSATSSSTSPRPRSARCASATTNTASPISPAAGSATPSRSIGRS